MEDKKYPQDYSTAELKTEIGECGKTSPHQHNSGSFYARASLGILELQGRQNSKVMWLSLAIAALALLVSLSQMKLGYERNCDYTGSVELKNQTKRCWIVAQWGVHKFLWEDSEFGPVKYD